MGLFSGLILFACVLISAFSTGGNVFTVSTAMRFLLMMIGGAFGGVLAVNKRKKSKNNIFHFSFYYDIIQSV